MARVVCVMRDRQDYSRAVFEWMNELKRRTGREIEVLNPDENVGFCEAYDIVEYPTILAIGERGDVRATWRGRDLPLIDNVTAYLI